MPSTNNPQGMTNVYPQTTMGNLVFPDPTRCHTWMDDFDDYVAAEWTITEVGSGTRAVGDIDGGVLVITNGATDDNHNFLQWSGATNAATVETWTWETSKSMWFKTRLKISDATQSDLVIGLQVTDTSPLDAADGLFFLKSDGSTTLNFKAVKTGASTSTVTTATLSDDTYFTCGFFWDADVGALTVFYNDNAVGTLTSTDNFPTTELTISFGIQDGTDAAAVLSLDYICVVKDRQGPTG